jgi:hypothetical protein
MSTPCPSFGSYSFQDCILTFNGRRVVGFGESDDAAIVIERAENLGELMKGADNYAIFNYMPDNTAKVKFELMPISPWVNIFEELNAVAKLGVLKPNTITFRDTKTGRGGSCTTAMLSKLGNLSYGSKRQKTIEIEITCLCWIPNTINYTTAV